MFCCMCGAKIYHEAKYCHNCASALPDPTLDIGPLPEDNRSKASSIAARSASGSETKSDRKDPRCHKCGASDGLKAWNFGLGKADSTKRAWGETAISAALSAVTVPLIGFGMLRLPGKRTSFTVLRLRLVLCDACWRDRAGYSSHPFWNEANSLGYTEFFGPTELDKLEPVP